MTILQKLKERFSRDSVTLDLHDIQALILRSRPEPYVGIHAMLHFDEAEGARALRGQHGAHLGPVQPPAPRSARNRIRAAAAIIPSFAASLCGAQARSSVRTSPLPKKEMRGCATAFFARRTRRFVNNCDRDTGHDAARVTDDTADGTGERLGRRRSSAQWNHQQCQHPAPQHELPHTRFPPT